MGGGIPEPDEKDEEAICSRTTKTRQEPEVTGESSIHTHFINSTNLRFEEFFRKRQPGTENKT